ncbi:MAG: hypothetical protein ACRDZ2_15765 [Ilumatobacteraceae bacterium]
MSRLAERNTTALALLRSLRAAQQWPPIVPTMVLVESLHCHPGRNANTNRFLRTCLIEEAVPQTLARRAAEVRQRAQRGSAVDALVVALAEPGGTILTGGAEDLEALAANAVHVSVLIA